MVYERRTAGVRRMCAVAPPGAGKTTVMAQLAVEEVERGGKVVVYCHRTMLLEQMSRVFTEKKIDHGVFAPGYKREQGASIEIGMIDTAYSRNVKRGSEDLFDATLVLVDEWHNQKGKKAESVLVGASGAANFLGHSQRGATIVGFTATPVGLAHLCDELVSFGNYSELRQVKAHLPVTVASPSEISCAGLSRNADCEYSSRDLEPRAEKIIGDAYENWKKLNPDALPAILFGPSVPGAFWFAHQFMQRGVRVAAVGNGLALMPELQPSGNWQLVQHPLDKDAREEILRLSKSGEIAVLCNRFILREAIDMPWLYHGIFATVFGSITSYLQSVGRIQRFWPDYQTKILQDHGGSYWRHLSPNLDRHWSITDTNQSVSKNIVDGYKSGGIKEPLQCPRCDKWRTGGDSCPHCGHIHSRSVRKVYNEDGVLVVQEGGVYEKPVEVKGDVHAKLWQKCLYGCGIASRPFSQAVRLFHDRCAATGLEKISPWTLKLPPPEFDSKEYHLPVWRKYPWMRKASS
jgi:DNA repair protein RadD